jgi:hypothetical protein
MAKSKGKPYPQGVLDLMSEKTAILSKAHALEAMGLPEITKALWEAAASCEERLAPLLDTLGREEEAAVHRISAASCSRRAGDASRAVNLFRAALAGPLSDGTRGEVERMLSESLAELSRAAPLAGGRSGRKGKPGG